MNPQFDIDFLIDPGLISKLDLVEDGISSKAILNLITSTFPVGSFAYREAKAGKPPSLACNRYLAMKGEIQVCLFVLQKRQDKGRLQCGILAWLIPRSSFMRARYKPDEIDFQLVSNLRAKLEVVLADLGAKDLVIRDKGLSPSK